MKKNESRLAFMHVLLQLMLWITGVLVSLAVGFGMTDGILTVRFIPVAVTAVAGWVVVVLTIVTVLLAFFDR